MTGGPEGQIHQRPAGDRDIETLRPETESTHRSTHRLAHTVQAGRPVRHVVRYIQRRVGRERVRLSDTHDVAHLFASISDDPPAAFITGVRVSSEE